MRKLSTGGSTRGGIEEDTFGDDIRGGGGMGIGGRHGLRNR